MKAIIIEDEMLSNEHLQGMLQRIAPDIEVTHSFDSVKSSVRAFKAGLTADLLFLDIHLGDGISFEILSQVSVNMPIIFTTAYDNYAIKAFKHNSIDYLLKPIALSDLQMALEKLRKQKPVEPQQLLNNLQEVYRQISKPYKTRFMVKVGNTIDTIQLKDINHFHTQESNTLLITREGRRYPIDYSLEQLEQLVPPDQFFRINRKTLIHIEAIEKVSAYVNSRFIVQSKHLDSPSSIVSRERVIEFKSWLDR